MLVWLQLISPQQIRWLNESIKFENCHHDTETSWKNTYRTYIYILFGTSNIDLQGVPRGSPSRTKVPFTVSLMFHDVSTSKATAISPEEWPKALQLWLLSQAPRGSCSAVARNALCSALAGQWQRATRMLRRSLAVKAAGKASQKW